jgi:putative sterol carrier protein
VTTLRYVVGSEAYDVDAPGGDGALTLTTTAEVWSALVGGALDPVVAFMQGRLKVAGDMAALYELLPTIPLPDA